MFFSVPVGMQGSQIRITPDVPMERKPHSFYLALPT